MSKLKTRIDAVLIYTLMTLIVVMLFCVCWQVFSRYFIKMPAVFTEELVRFLLIWVGLLGAAYSFGAHKHLSLSLIKDKCPSHIRLGLAYLIIAVIIFVVCSLLIYGGTKLMHVTWKQKSSILQIPMGYVYAILPLSGILTLFYKGYDLYQLITKGDMK